MSNNDIEKFKNGFKGKITAILFIIVLAICSYLGYDYNNDDQENNNAYQEHTYEAEEHGNGDADYNEGIIDSSSKNDNKIEPDASNSYNTLEKAKYTFKNAETLISHFIKHNAEFNYANKEEYEKGANRVILSNNSLHKLEKEDGDDIYYLEETNEIVFVSKSGYIRSYFKPSKGKAYYDKQ